MLAEGACVDETEGVCDPFGAPVGWDAAGLGSIEDVRLHVRPVEQKRELAVATIRDREHLGCLRETAFDGDPEEFSRDPHQRYPGGTRTFACVVDRASEGDARLSPHLLASSLRQLSRGGLARFPAVRSWQVGTLLARASISSSSPRPRA